MKFSRNVRTAIAIYLAALLAYGAASGQRLRGHTNDNHYVRLADGWLHRRLDLGAAPGTMDDRADIETLWLKDGRVLRGAMVFGTSQAFRTMRDGIVNVTPEEIERRQTQYYVSFPPFPALLMLPFVALWGLETNDVLFNILIAALAPALLFLLLRRLRTREASQRTFCEDLWLTALLGVGSVFYYSAVIGQVWYTAHVVSVVLVLLYVMAALDARYPFAAGLCLVCGFLCRPEILFAAPLFLWELARVHSRPREGEAPQGFLPQLRDRWHRFDRAAALRTLLRFGAPIAVVGLAAAAHNIVRFGRPTEFGHTFLNVRWKERIQHYGLFNYTFLGRNLACMLALTPKIIAGWPYVQTSHHGLALWVTSPALLYLLWPQVKGPLHRPLWLTTACMAIPDLLYQNSGWIQFGYRFSLDYMVLLVCLLAIGGRPMTRWFKFWIIAGVAVNLFGAITFGQAPQFSFEGYFPPGIE